MKESVQYLIQKDKIFQQIIDEFGFPEIIPSRPEGFETLVLLILEQQVSIDSAKATFLRMRDAVTNIEPSVLIAVPEEEFRVFGVSRQKTKYIKCLSEAILSKSLDLENLASKSSDQIRSELIKIKGIGNWTIDVYLMFCLQHPDILPLGDVAIITTMKELLNIHEKQHMEAHAQLWAPYKTMASFLLWHYYLKKRNRKIAYEY